MSKRPRRNRRLAFKARVASSPAGTRATWKITSDAPFRGEAARATRICPSIFSLASRILICIARASNSSTCTGKKSYRIKLRTYWGSG